MYKRTATAFAVTAAAGLVLAGCSSADEEATAEPTDGSTAAGETTEGGDLTLAVFNGWDESLATSLLWQAILEEKGYNVELEYADVAPVFQGIADGDYDIVTDVWLPATHEQYLDQFGDDMEEIGAWYDDAPLTITVNADAPVDSIADLPDYVDEMGGQIVGIEPGAGLTGAAEEAIEVYGLEDYEFVTSSTPAMLQELDTATSNGENIVVTLWEPHWAYGAYDIKNLEDPEGAMGEGDSIVTYGRTGISEDFPEVTEWLANFEMDGDLLADLEVPIVEGDEADYEQIVSDWIAENQEWVDSLTA